MARRRTACRTGVPERQLAVNAAIAAAAALRCVAAAARCGVGAGVQQQRGPGSNPSALQEALAGAVHAARAFLQLAECAGAVASAAAPRTRVAVTQDAAPAQPAGEATPEGNAKTLRRAAQRRRQRQRRAAAAAVTRQQAAPAQASAVSQTAERQPPAGPPRSGPAAGTPPALQPIAALGSVQQVDTAMPDVVFSAGSSAALPSAQRARSSTRPQRAGNAARNGGVRDTQQRHRGGAPLPQQRRQGGGTGVQAARGSMHGTTLADGAAAAHAYSRFQVLFGGEEEGWDESDEDAMYEIDAYRAHQRRYGRRD